GYSEGRGVCRAQRGPPMTPGPLLAAGDGAALHALRRVSVEDVLLPLLAQLAVIILAARLFAALLRRLGQPGVVGEIVAGLGLVLLLFLIGLQFDFGHLRRHGGSALAISVAGVALPFGLGLGLAFWMHPHVAAGVPPLGFALFLGTALSITAIPVLGRIMMEL